MFEKLFKKKETEPVIGYAFSFSNAQFGLEAFGSPKELIDEFASKGLKASDLFEHIDTGVGCNQIFKSAPSIEFTGGPLAESKIELLESFSQRKYKRFEEYLIELISNDELDPSILSMIAADGNVQAIDLVVKNGGNFDEPSELGMSPLHWAAAKGNDQAVKLLLKNTTSVDRQNWFNAFPSELAEINGHQVLSAFIAKHMREPSVKFSPEKALKRMGCNT